MRKVYFAVLLGLTAALSLIVVAFAKEYVINVIVDGKPVALSVVVEGDTLQVKPQSPGVEVASVTAVPTVATQPATTTATATANRNANLRSGPGTTYAVAGSVRTGQALTLTGRNQAGDWLQVADGTWVAAFLVNNAPAGLPVVGASTTQALPPASAPAQPTALPAPTATAVPAPVATSACDPSYPTLCIPPNSPDLDCPDIGAKNFPVLSPDPHRLDRDKDGVGCES